MKVTFFVLFLLIISSAQAISNEQGKELNGNLNATGNVEVSTSLNNKNATVASKNEHKHAMLRASLGGGRKGGGGGGGKGRGKGGGGVGAVGGEVVGGVVGGGIVRSCPPFTYCYCPPFSYCPPYPYGYPYGYGHRYNDSSNSTTTSSAGAHFCVSTFVLFLSFLALITLIPFFSLDYY